jgi:hypothetical protein
MEAEFVVSAIIPTDDGQEEIRLTPKSADKCGDLTTVWAIRPPHGLKVGETVVVGKWS